MPTVRAVKRDAGRLLLLLVIMGSVAVSCGGSDDSAGESAQPAATRPSALAEQAAAGTARDVVYSGQVVVSVAGVSRAADRATDVVERAGGFLFSQTADLEGDVEVRVTYKVPPDEFRPVLDRLGALGRTLSRTSTAEDVTAKVVDLEGRLAGAQASASRLRQLLTGADTTADVISIEKELETREADIESMQGRLRVLRDQVDLATIDARFTERRELAVDHDLPGFLEGFRTGVVALVTGAVLVLSVVGFLLPFLPCALVGLLAWRWYRRRHPAPPRVVPSFPPPPR
jgi:hypothetical protein